MFVQQKSLMIGRNTSSKLLFTEISAFFFPGRVINDRGNDNSGRLLFKDGGGCIAGNFFEQAGEGSRAVEPNKVTGIGNGSAAFQKAFRFFYPYRCQVLVRRYAI